MQCTLRFKVEERIDAEHCPFPGLSWLYHCLTFGRANPSRPGCFAGRAASGDDADGADGRRPAWSITPNGRHDITQTERIGTFLGGSVRVIEGRGYNADGTVGFNALGVISFDPATNSYTISSWAMGHNGVFPFRVTAEGYEWEVAAGPGATIRYSATVTADTLREIGFLVAGSAPPRQIFEMNLRRVGPTDWPGAGAIPMR